MYAIVEIGGKQFRVSKDLKLRVPRLDSEAGMKIGFDQVLLVDDGNGKTTIGNPIVKNMLVNATVIGHDRDKKVLVFKKKRRKGYQKKQGHRQGYSIIEINTIGSGTLKKETAPVKTKVESVKTESAAAKVEKPAAAKPAAEKKTATKTTTKKTVTKSDAEAGQKTKPPAKKAAPKKTAVKEETKPAAVKKETKPPAAKKPAAKKDKKED
jgi:large subunit ribosomal protein L21